LSKNSGTKLTRGGVSLWTRRGRRRYR